VNSIPYPEEAKSIKLDYSGPRLTPDHDVRAILWLARGAPGGILEIGCHTGRTTGDLAREFPHREIIAVDCSDTMAGAALPVQQRHEQPGAAQIGELVKDMPNVRVFDCQSGKFLRKLINGDEVIKVPIGFVFIDGNHSYDGVKADTELAMEYLRTHGGGTVVWHDVYDDGPAWIGVRRYLEDEIAPHHPVRRIQGTWLAMLKIPA
jgi:predicted O-methyltransferase YrrM